MKSAVLILGAAGDVGRGLVEAAIAGSRPVIAVARDNREFDALRAGFPERDVTVLTASLAHDASGARLVARVRELGRPLAGVIAILCGGDEHGRLLDQPAAMLRRKLDQELQPHLVAARHLLPLLAQPNRGGSYVMIGGPGSRQPWAGHGYRSIAGAALHMLARVLHDEALAVSVRLQLLAVDTPIRTDDNADTACPQWPTARAIGERALALIEHAGPAIPTRAIVRYSSATSHLETPLTTHAARSHDPDGSASPLRCLQDARALLQKLSSSTLNQESTP